ncbi:MAG: hypothetical protein EOO20_29030 [Chryseobacterium sp.]|nr:MAG: hypothetical protein EOO20_29030 [Chryseobacterium sp.]
MMVKAIIVEQLESNGEMRTFQMQADKSRGALVVALADEYNVGSTNSLDLEVLASELGKLRGVARQQATEAEHDTAVGAIAQAESAAKEGNENDAMQYLAKSGTWALDIATKVGVSVAAEAIKKNYREKN